MKIAVVGAHGVGKTTFAKAIASKLGLNYIHDVVREEAVNKGFVINEKTSSEVQLWLVLRQWELERMTPESWVADKSLYDYLVYGELILEDKTAKRVIRQIVERNALYDFIFYLPIEFVLEFDGVRSQNLEFQKRVDSVYRRFLNNNNINYVTVRGNLEERVKLALRLIDGKSIRKK